jgi:hypothetical protein
MSIIHSYKKEVTIQVLGTLSYQFVYLLAKD